ncbi:transmembrane protein 232 isoform X1 [Alosa sapidissima]|uniref:transmembrane protein 232 isoform X1 n=1 Tax=Alosa sapidissima TaxID=34773 RepID=UPI001C0845E7|nr:transmembrane protein 232 isoform X1 [Alosa sapidissima]
MPIRKIQVVHSLALISQTHQEELQERLIRRSEVSGEVTDNKSFHATKNPFEVTEEFIVHFNHAQSGEEQERYIELANQLLSGIKRRAGLKSMGEGNHVELPLAWKELLLLSLCNGQIQNAALDALLVSLDQAPLQTDQITVLFYLGESVLYSVWSDASSKPNLYTCEMKLLKLGYLVFLRLFLFHMSEDLIGYERSRAHLHSFLNALSHCEACYHQFPDISFAVHFMLSVGQIICGSETSGQDSDQQVSATVVQEYEVSHVLWDCLLCWYSEQHSIPQLPNVVEHLILHRDQMLQDNWVDSSLGLLVLGEAAKTSLQCLQALMGLHVWRRQEGGEERAEEGGIPPRGAWPWQLEHVYCSALADICLQSKSAEIQKVALAGQASQPGHRDAGGLLSLLKLSEQEGNWRLRYSAVQAVARVCRDAEGGLRNAAWLALQEQLSHEQDQRVHTAMTLSEAWVVAVKTPTQPDGAWSPPSSPAVLPCEHLISSRLAHFLSHLYLPATPHEPSIHSQLYSAPEKRIHPRSKSRGDRALSERSRVKTPVPVIPKVESGRQTPRSSQKQAHVDFVSRTDTDLMKVIEDQWQKELQIKIAEEEEIEKEEMAKHQKEVLEKFEGIMRRRKEILRKNTKPYELVSFQTTSCAEIQD